MLLVKHSKKSLTLMRNVVTSSAKSILVPLGLMAAASSTDAGILMKVFGSGTTLVVSNEEMDIIKVVNSLEQSGLLVKGVSEIIAN